MVENGQLVEYVDLYKPTLGFRTGLAFYASGNANNFSEQHPFISLTAKSNLPFLHKKIAFQFDFSYFRVVVNYYIRNSIPEKSSQFPILLSTSSLP